MNIGIEILIAIGAFITAVTGFAGHWFGSRNHHKSLGVEQEKTALSTLIEINTSLREQLTALQGRVEALETRIDQDRARYEKALASLREENRRQNEQLIIFRAKCTGCLSSVEEIVK